MNIKWILFVYCFQFSLLAEAAGIEDYLGANGVKLLPKLKIEQEHKVAVKGSNFYYATGTYANGSFRLEVISPLEAKQASVQLSERSAQVESIYDGVQDPYFVAITKKTTCAKAYQLVREKKNSAVYYSAFASSNRAFGACVRKDIMFEVEIASLYCEKKKELLYLELKRQVQGELPSLNRRKESLHRFSQLGCD